MKLLTIFICFAVCQLQTAVSLKPTSAFSRNVLELDNSQLSVISSNSHNSLAYVFAYSKKNCSGACLSAKRLFDDSAKELSSLVTVSAVDVDDYDVDKVVSALKLGDETLPVIRMVGKGNMKTVPAPKSKAELRKHVDAELSSAVTVPRVTAASLRGLLAQPLPRLLLFTAKKETSSLWRSVALSLQGSTLVGEVQKSERKVCRDYDVSEFPSIVLVRGKDDFVTYSGTIKASAVLAWTQKYVKPKFPVLPYIADQSCFKALCKDNTGICLLVAQPGEKPEATERMHASPRVNISDKEALAAIATLKAASQAADTMQPLHSAYFYTASNPLATTGFSLATEDYPQLVAYSPSKGVAAVMLQGFNYDNVLQYIQEFASGKITTSVVAEDLTSTTDTSMCVTLQEFYDQRIQYRNTVTTSNSNNNNSNTSKNNNSTPSMDNDLPKWAVPPRTAGKRGNAIPLESAEQLKALAETRNLPIFVVATGDIAVQKQFESVAMTSNSMLLVSIVGCDVAKNILSGLTCGKYALLKDLAALQLDYTNAHERVAKAVFYDIPKNAEESKLATLFLSQGLQHVDISKISTPQDFERAVSQDVLMPKVILMTSTATTPYLLRALAVEFYQFAKVLIATPSEALKQQFQVQQVPAMRIMKPVLKPTENKESFQLQMEMVPLAKEVIYYNNVARVLDSIVSNRYTPQTSPSATTTQARPNKEEL